MTMNSLLLPENAIEVIRGETKTLRLTVQQKDPTGEKSWIPVDLTDSVIYFTVKKEAEHRETLIAKRSSVVGEAEITNPRGGVAEIYLIPSDTDCLDATDYVYDVWVYYTATAKRYPVVTPSVFRVVPGVTRIPV